MKLVKYILYICHYFIIMKKKTPCQVMEELKTGGLYCGGEDEISDTVLARHTFNKITDAKYGEGNEISGGVDTFVCNDVSYNYSVRALSYARAAVENKSLINPFMGKNSHVVLAIIMQETMAKIRIMKLFKFIIEHLMFLEKKYMIDSISNNNIPVLPTIKFIINDDIVSDPHKLNKITQSLINIMCLYCNINFIELDKFNEPELDNFIIKSDDDEIRVVKYAEKIEQYQCYIMNELFSITDKYMAN